MIMVPLSRDSAVVVYEGMSFAYHFQFAALKAFQRVLISYESCSMSIAILRPLIYLG